jgi:predicted RNase H-like HicB family nuclease
MDILISCDGNEFFVECVKLPMLYGIGNTKEEAVAMFVREIASLRKDLMEDDNFSQEFLDIKVNFCKLLRGVSIYA